MAPLYMGHRPEVERSLLDMLDHLRDGRHGPHFHYLYGPRGNGKTVLLDWLDRQAWQRDGPEGMIRLRLLPMALDEAHEADPRMLGNLLNAVQYAGRTRPVGVVLAGTPGLVDTLDASNATFWNRGRRLPVGLLSNGEAHSVLAHPLAQAGVAAKEPALAALVQAADNYPFFLQLYGEAVWNALQRSAAAVLSTAHVEATIRAVEPRRRQYYQNRYREFRNDGTLALVYDVALVFRDAGGEMTDSQIDAVLAKHDGSIGTMLSLLNSRGFIWQNSNDHWTSGIPSLMGCVIEHTASMPGADGPGNRAMRRAVTHSPGRRHAKPAPSFQVAGVSGLRTNPRVDPSVCQFATR